MDVSTGSPLLLSLMPTVASLAFFLFALAAPSRMGSIVRNWSRDQCLHGRHSLRFSSLLRSISQSLPDPRSRISHRRRIAVDAPASTSIVRQIVSDAELPSAAVLGSLQFSIAGIIGPALGGLLVWVAGASFVFALNAACFLLVVVATWQWKQPTRPAKPPSETFFQSFGTIIRYVRNAPGFQVVLARNFLLLSSSQ